MLLIRKNNKGFWQFHRDGVTQSLINKYRQCPIQAKLAYYDGYAPKAYKKNMHFGNCIHHVLSEAYRKISAPLNGQILSLVKQYEEIWEAEQKAHCGEFTIEQQKIWDEIYILAEAVLITYFSLDFVKRDFKTNWLFTERAFKIPYSFLSVTGETSHTFLRGKMDGGFFAEGYNDNPAYVKLTDHKCMEMINHEAIKAVMPYDIQCNLYMLAFYKETGHFPLGIYKNIIRIPQTKQKKDESKVDFIERFRETVAADPDHYFHRFWLPIAPEEILEWEKNWLIPNLQEIECWYNSGCKNKTMNPDALYNRFGPSEWLPLIAQGLHGFYYKRKHIFPELESDVYEYSPAA